VANPKFTSINNKEDTMGQFIVRVEDEIVGRYDDEGTAVLIAQQLEEEDGIQPELIDIEEIKPKEIKAEPEYTAEHRFDEDGVYNTENVLMFEYIILDEEGFPEQAFNSEVDVEYMVEQIQKSEGFDPIVVCRCADGNYRRYTIG
jgi:hypothetical protein